MNETTVLILNGIALCLGLGVGVSRFKEEKYGQAGVLLTIAAYAAVSIIQLIQNGG